MYAKLDTGDRPDRAVIQGTNDLESRGPTTGGGFADLKRVREQTSLSRSTIYREVSKGRFPRPRKLSPGRVGWLCSEVEGWMAARAAGGQP